MCETPGRSSKLALATLIIMGGLLAAGCRPAVPQYVQGGSDLYTACVHCHGARGEGVPLYGAPAIAGLPAWYLEDQLQKFRSGVRGLHPDDPEGLRMRPMSRQIKTDEGVVALAKYLSEQPAPDVVPSLAGADVEAGKERFGVCIACHGPEAGGNQALKAPPLRGQHDWYLFAQLRKFKSGVRGANPADVTGAQMRPMAMALPDDQAMKNVAAYIATFGRPR